MLTIYTYKFIYTQFGNQLDMPHSGVGDRQKDGGDRNISPELAYSTLEDILKQL
jgi:hypothetical protein